MRFSRWREAERMLTPDNCIFLSGSPKGWLCKLNDGTMGFSVNREIQQPFQTEIEFLTGGSHSRAKGNFNPSEIGDNTHYLAYREDGHNVFRFFKLTEAVEFYYGFGKTKKLSKYDGFKYNAIKGKNVYDVLGIGGSLRFKTYHPDGFTCNGKPIRD
jgi:hypothetical protein